MVFVLRPFHAYPHRFVGLNNTSTFRLVFSNCTTSFPVQIMSKSTKHCGWHRNFQLSTSIFHYTLEFFIIRINKENTTQTSLRALVSRLPTFASLCVSMRQTYVSTFLAIQCLALRSSAFLSVSTRTRCIHPVVSHSIQ